MQNYAKVIVKGSPITKSNFKLHNNTTGRAILPSNSGQYCDRYALYEQEIALIARSQNPDTILNESLIAVLKVFYKSEKRHPDTINISKSIFDGIEKSGLIVNDAQITRIIIEEFYDKENPRFELELFGESSYCLNYVIKPKSELSAPKTYKSFKKNISNSKKTVSVVNAKNPTDKICDICNNTINDNNYITADNGSKYICNKCLKKLF